MRRIISLACLLSVGFLTACSDGSTDVGQEADQRLNALIQQLGMTGDPTTNRNLPAPPTTVNTTPVVELGKLLFFSQGLSGRGDEDEFDTACASCHHPALAGSDDLSLPYGVNSDVPELLGPGREFLGSNDTPIIGRNSISLINIGLWDHALNHDGSVESLNPVAFANGSVGSISTPDSGFGVADDDAGENLVTAQTRLSLANAHMMRNGDLDDDDTNDVIDDIVDRLRDDNNDLPVNNWLEEFRTGFEDPTGTATELITPTNLITALAEYQRSLVFTVSPWARYAAGGNLDAISLDAKQGAILALTSVNDGGLGCVDCHSGDFFTDEQYHVLAVPQIGAGMGNDNGQNTDDDFGRFNVTGVEADRYAFRTPTLLNVARTGPWGHDGAYTTLEAMVRHHFDPETNVEEYNASQLDPEISAANVQENTGFAIDVLNDQIDNDQTLLVRLTTGDQQVTEIMAFLNALTDVRLADAPVTRTQIHCVAPWVPNASNANPDQLRLNANSEDDGSLSGDSDQCQ